MERMKLVSVQSTESTADALSHFLFFHLPQLVVTRFTRQLKAYLTATNGKRALQPNKPKVMPNGLASVAEGLNLLQSDQVHGEKLVYRISDTPKSGGA